MKPIRLISTFFCLSLALYLTLLSGSGSAQGWDGDYEQRAQIVISGLLKINGLTGWTPNSPVSWPEATQSGPTSFKAERAAQAVIWNRETRPARLVSLTLANTGLQRVADFSGLSYLKRLEVYGNQLRGLNLDGNHELIELAAMKNQLGSLNLRSCPKLGHLSVSTNHLKELDLSAAPLLKKLSASSNQLRNLDISNNPELIDLEVMNNALSSLDLSNAHHLNRLVISYNRISEIDLSFNQQLVEFGARNNLIDRIDLNANTQLQDLNVSRNNLKELNLENLGHLIRLSADQNQISSINLSYCLNAKNIELNNNPLAEIIIGDNQFQELQSLNLDNCRLPLSALLPLTGKAKSRARFGSQENVLFENLTLTKGQGLDLSSEADLAETPTRFVVLNEKKRRVRPELYNENQGLISFNSPGRYYVEMSNDKVVSSETNQLTGRVRTFKVKAVTGLIEVVLSGGEVEL